jgi:hypothetical protein
MSFSQPQAFIVDNDAVTLPTPSTSEESGSPVSPSPSIKMETMDIGSHCDPVRSNACLSEEELAARKKQCVRLFFFFVDLANVLHFVTSFIKQKYEIICIVL